MSKSLQKHPWMYPAGAIRLAVSACLLGRPVRWDGAHKRDRLLAGLPAGMLAEVLEYAEVCPEVAAGLGVPRPPIRLTGSPGRYRALGAGDPSLDPSEALRLQGRQVASAMDGPEGWIDGAVLKSGSPSCGLRGVPVYGPRGGIRDRNGSGLFAAELMAARPELPVIDEIGLNDPTRREHFFGRVAAYRRWRAFLRGGTDSAADSAALAAFHEAHRLTLLSHGVYAGALWKALFGEREAFSESDVAEYGRVFQQALGWKPTRRRHGWVLRRLAHAVIPALDKKRGDGLRKAVEAYASGKTHRSTPLLMLRDHFEDNPHPLAEGQTYLAPHPLELLGESGGIEQDNVGGNITGHRSSWK